MSEPQALDTLAARVCQIQRLLENPAAFVQEQDDIAAALRQLASLAERRHERGAE